MLTKRSYDDGCACAHALDLVGERWALLVIRELLLGPKRFTDLRTGLPGISPNVLTQRLQELEEVDVVRRRKLPPPAATWVYEVTEWGEELEPIIMALGRWGARSNFMSREAQLSVNSLILSFRTMFDPESADGVAATYELRLGEHTFAAVVADNQIEITPGSAHQPDAIIEAEPTTLAGVVYDAHSITQALRSGGLRIQGDKAAVKRFATLFSLPAKAAAS